MAEKRDSFLVWPRDLEEREGRILYALRSFQIIEMILKEYLCRAGRSAVTESAKKNFVVKKVKHLALDDLIKSFKTVNGNSELHAQLKQSVKLRDEIAHTALISHHEEAAVLVGARHLDLDRLRCIDRVAAKTMSQLLVEYIKTQPKVGVEDAQPGIQADDPASGGAAA